MPLRIKIETLCEAVQLSIPANEKAKNVSRDDEKILSQHEKVKPNLEMEIKVKKEE